MIPHPPVRNPYRRPVHPGAMLREDVLPALGLSPVEFAQKAGIGVKALTGILDETRPVTLVEADAIGALCGNGADIWLRLQPAYDQWQPPLHDFRHAAFHRIADWPVLSALAARGTKAKRIDSRAVAALYARATDADRQAMDSRERVYMEAALIAYPPR